MANVKYSIIPNNPRLASIDTDFRDCCGKSLDTNGCTLIMCTAGYAIFSIDFKNYSVRKGDFISISYEMTFIPLKVSSTFSARVISLPIEVCESTFFQISQTSFWDYLLQHPILTLKNDVQKRMLADWFHQVHWVIGLRKRDYKNEMLQQHYSNLFMALYNELSEVICGAKQEEKKDRGWYLAGQFMNLVNRHYVKHHDVEYYAKRLFITSEYLSKITHKVHGASPKELIDNQLISAIKSLLATTDLSVKQIATELNFTDPSYMCRYFKRFTNLSPLGYRKHTMSLHT